MLDSPIGSGGAIGLERINGQQGVLIGADGSRRLIKKSKQTGDEK